MNTHPYLRAYLAGVFVPTLGLPVLLFAFVLLRLVFEVPFPIERGLIFPLALVPCVWGLWNMIWLALRATRPIPSGIHGAILPLLLMPAGACIASSLGILDLGSRGVTWFQNLYVPYALIAPCFLAAIAAYYLVWKYVVGFLNRTLGFA
jgi:hypothetical protein